MLVPDEPEISKIADWSVTAATKGRREDYRVLLEHMQSVESLFSPVLSPPPTKKAIAHCDKIFLGCSCQVSTDDGFHWRRRFCELLGDELTVYNSPSVPVPSSTSTSIQYMEIYNV